jgi:hypothetical protein
VARCSPAGDRLGVSTGSIPVSPTSISAGQSRFPESSFRCLASMASPVLARQPTVAVGSDARVRHDRASRAYGRLAFAPAAVSPPLTQGSGARLRAPPSREQPGATCSTTSTAQLLVGIWKELDLPDPVRRARQPLIRKAPSTRRRMLAIELPPA